MVRTTKKKPPVITNEERLEQTVVSIIVDGEYETAKRNKENEIIDFESYIDLLECERTERNYDWMSDIFLPEFPAHILTQSSLDANQYFQTRDYVEMYLQEGGIANVDKADAAQECINRTLNQKHIYFYQKFMRAKIINQLNGSVYARCWWEKQAIPTITYKNKIQVMDVDVDGNPIVDPAVQVPAIQMIQEPVQSEQVILDRFNFDIIDPRNVFTDNTYTYSIQQKDWIIIRFEKTYHELKDDEQLMGYINLDQLKNIKPPEETQASKDSYNKDLNQQKPAKPVSKSFDIIERYGGFWVIVEDGKIRAGYNELGEIAENAEYIETVITFALSDNSKILIRFQPNYYRDSAGNVFKPILRGLNYIHPTKDNGMGDGKFTRELQVAINDTFNVSNDRTMLATMPTMKGRKYATEDNTTIRFEPNHVIQLENSDDLTEFKWDDNTVGALNQIAMLTSNMDKVMGIYPPQMGQLPSMSSTTATAFAGAQNSGNVRSNYKSMTFEYTFLTELFWMILQMSNQFAEADTGLKLMGNKVYNFDASADYVYKPVSQSIEAEVNKNVKKQSIIQLISFVASVPNPKTPVLVNKLLSKYFKLSGDEYEEFADALLDERVPITQTGGTPDAGGQPMSNQNGMMQSSQEQMARQQAPMGGMGG